MSNIVGPTGLTGVQSPTAAFFTDPFSASVFPASPRSTGTGSMIVARQIAEPPLQANGHRPGSPTAGVSPSSGIVRNIPSPTLPRSDWAAPESWAVDGTGPKEEDYSSESDDGLAPSTYTMAGTSLPGRSDSLAGSISTTRPWKPPGSAGSGANRDGAANGGAFGRMGADMMSGGASTRGDRRLNSAGSMRSYAPTLANGIGAMMCPRGSGVTASNGPSFNMALDHLVIVDKRSLLERPCRSLIECNTAIVSIAALYSELLVARIITYIACDSDLNLSRSQSVLRPLLTLRDNSTALIPLSKPVKRPVWSIFLDTAMRSLPRKLTPHTAQSLVDFCEAGTSGTTGGFWSSLQTLKENVKPSSDKVVRESILAPESHRNVTPWVLMA
ncbi:hypothetical protein FRC12_012501 [Ceratobasidium sp. 428]|nr:hypothetical protein FRC12_012501 [Ceratobasidium sp. 428]